MLYCITSNIYLALCFCFECMLCNGGLAFDRHTTGHDSTRIYTIFIRSSYDSHTPEFSGRVLIFEHVQKLEHDLRTCTIIIGL